MATEREYLQSIPIELSHEATAFAGKAFQAGYNEAISQCIMVLVAAQSVLEKIHAKHPELNATGKEYRMIKHLLLGAPK